MRVFDLLISVFSKLLGNYSYLRLVPLTNPIQIKLLETHLLDIWKTERYREFLLQSSTALAASSLLKIGFTLRRAPYLIKLILYSVRGQALLAGYRDVSPLPRPKPHDLKPHSQSFDYIVIGSGAAGSTIAYNLSKAGKSTLILEEGAWFRKENFTPSTYTSIQNLFREQGMQFAFGKSIIPVLQASCVGGTTVINGAICHPLPQAIYEDWSKNHGTNRAFSWDELSVAYQELGSILGLKNDNGLVDYQKFPLHHFLDKQNWHYQIMNRSAPNCQETGRCLQGCPTGAKLSMENSLIPKALEYGAVVLPEHKVNQIELQGNRATGVQGFQNGRPFKYVARKGVILAAGAIHSPWLLSKSGIRLPHLGRHFQCHLGVSSLAKFAVPYRNLQGPLQGTEIIQFNSEKIKLATQLIPLELLFARADMDSSKIISALESSEFYGGWMGSVQAESEGYLGFQAKPKIHFDPSHKDLIRLSTSLNYLKTLLEGMQATEIYPSILNQKALNFTNPEHLDSRDFLLGIGHIFGTCRMGSSSNNSVTDYEFKVHHTENLYCCDASIFPTNIGVNPQMAIMSLAQIATQRILATDRSITRS